MEEYLPPVVTKLRADLSDLVLGLAQARAMVAGFARGARDDVVSTLRTAGRDAGLAFAGGWTSVAAADMTAGFDRDVGSSVAREATQMGQDVGASSARVLAASFRTVLMPLLIGVLIAATPVLVTALSAVVTAGLSLAFIGLGVLALRHSPAIVAAATKLKDDVKAVFKDAASPLEGPIIRALSILDGLVKDIGPQLKQIFVALAPAIEPLTQGFAEFVKAAMPGLVALMGAGASLLIAMAGEGGTIGAGLSNMFQSMADATPGMIDMIKEFGPSIANFLTNTGEVIKFFADVTGWMARLKGKAEEGGWDTPLNAMATGAKKAWEWIVKISGAVGDWVSDKASKVADWWGGVTSAIETKGGQVLTWFKELPGKIGTFLSELPGKLGDAALAAFDAFFYWTSFGITRVVGFFIALPGVLAGWTVRAWDTVTEKFRSGVDRAVQFTQALPGRVSAFFRQLWADVTAWARQTWTDAVAWVKRTADDIIAWFEGLPERAKKQLDTFLQKAKDFFKGAKTWLVESGKDVIRGLLDGIESMISGAVSAVKRAMNRIKQGADDALGISSPSTEFEKSGKWSMKGFMRGVLGESGSLARVWSQVGLAGPGRVAGAGFAGGGALAAAGAGGGSATPTLVHAVFQVDGHTIVDAIVPAAQDRKKRNGESGLG